MLMIAFATVLLALRRTHLDQTGDGPCFLFSFFSSSLASDDRAREDDCLDERSGVLDVVDLPYAAAVGREPLELFYRIWLIRGVDGNETFLPPMFLVSVGCRALCETWSLGGVMSCQRADVQSG